MTGYGFYPGGDPRKFFPDEELCSPRELANHRLACEAMDRGGVMDYAHGCVRVDGRFINISSFGLGSYDMDDDSEDEEF